jgi:uncharacterized protein (TIGR03435 family)
MRTLALCIALVCSPFIEAQTARPEFEVATIKINAGGGQGSSYGSRSPGTLSAENVSLRTLIQQAYAVRGFQIQGLPSWVDSERYNLSAKARVDAAPAPVNRKTMDASFAEMEAMLVTLLEDRFQMKVHRETKEMPVYFVTIGKNGLKVKDTDCIEYNRDNPPPQPTAGQPPPRFCNNISMRGNGGNRILDAAGVTMEDLSKRLFQDLTGRVVIDKTGHTGRFDLKLEFLPEGGNELNRKLGASGGGDDANHIAENQAPSLFSALQEVGIKLEAGRGPVEMLVIDHIERLSSN